MYIVPVMMSGGIKKLCSGLKRRRHGGDLTHEALGRNVGLLLLDIEEESRFGSYMYLPFQPYFSSSMSSGF